VSAGGDEFKRDYSSDGGGSTMDPAELTIFAIAIVTIVLLAWRGRR
jgi:hypothetical protein